MKELAEGFNEIIKKDSLRETTEAEFNRYARDVAKKKGIDPDKFLKFWNLRGFGKRADYYVDEWATRIRDKKWGLADSQSRTALKQAGLMEKLKENSAANALLSRYKSKLMQFPKELDIEGVKFKLAGGSASSLEEYKYGNTKCYVYYGPSYSVDSEHLGFRQLKLMFKFSGTKLEPYDVEIDY